MKLEMGKHLRADSGRRNGADDEIQEVILKAMAGKLKWWEAAEIIGLTHPAIRRGGTLPRACL